MKTNSDNRICSLADSLSNDEVVNVFNVTSICTELVGFTCCVDAAVGVAVFVLLNLVGKLSVVLLLLHLLLGFFLFFIGVALEDVDATLANHLFVVSSRACIYYSAGLSSLKVSILVLNLSWVYYNSVLIRNVGGALSLTSS